MLTQESRRKFRIRNKIISSNKSLRPRIVVFKSNKNIYTQIVDVAGKVLTSFSTLNLKDDASLTGVKKAELTGAGLAKACLELGIKDVVFDRGQYTYCGRIKALADSCRSSGLNF